MTLYEFKALSENEQGSLTWNDGVYIDNRTEVGYKIVLYQVQSFYVEVYYNEKTNEIEKLRSFCSINQLEPYISAIKLDDLIK